MSLWTPFLFSALLSVSEPAAAAGDPTMVQGVVVTARSPEETRAAATAFVGAISAQSGNGRLARWDRKICPGVVGMKAEYAQPLIDRISVVAIQVGLDVAPPGCKPDIVIIATDAADAMAADLVAETPKAFAKYDSGLSRGRKALKAFVESDDPVRWWHVTRRVMADGQQYDRGSSVPVRGIGRLRSTTRDDFDHAVIIIDVTRTGVLRFPALTDYVAMVALAQIEPGGETAGVSSVLNLFRDRDAGLTPAESLTDWDLAYLKGLYAARRDVERGATQEQDVVRSVTDTLTEPPKDTGQP